MRSILALVLFAASQVCFAASIHAYKAVHSDGTVSYSDTWPGTASSVQTIAIPQTGDSTLEQGERRKQQMQDAGKQLDEQRAAESKARREYQAQLAQARQEVSDAERHLYETRNSKKNASAERTATAKQRLDLARKKLQELERAGPQQ